MLLIHSIYAIEKNYKLMCRSFALYIYSDTIDDKELASIQILISNAYREDLNKKAANKALKNQILKLESLHM